MRLKGFFIALLLLLPAILQVRAQETSMSELIKRVKPSVVTILCYDSSGHLCDQGTGFFIDSIHLVSCRHVFAAAFRAEYRTAAANVYPVQRVVADAPNSDLVEVEVAKPHDKFTPLKLAIKQPDVGERVVVISTPAGMELTASDGIVSAIRPDPSGKNCLQVTAPFSPGSSGGPVFDVSGEVVGVARMIFMEGENLNFATLSGEIMRMRKMPPTPLKIWSSAVRMAGGQYPDEEKPNDPDPGKADFLANYAMDRGKDYMNHGDFKHAVPMLQTAVSQKPSFGEAWLDLGICHIKLSEFGPASEALDNAAYLMPKSMDALYFLGESYYMLHRFADALKICGQMLMQDPNNGKAYHELGEVRMAMGQDTLAIPAFRSAILHNGFVARSYMLLGQIYCTHRQPDNAIQLERASLHETPTAEAWGTLGDAYGMKQNRDSAIFCLREAAGMHSSDPAILARIGESFIGVGDPSEADAPLRESLRIRPEFGQTHLDLGLALLGEHRPEDGFAECKLAIKYDPTLPEAHYTLGETYLYYKKDKAAALDEYKILLSLDKTGAEMLFNEIYK